MRALVFFVFLAVHLTGCYRASEDYLERQNENLPESPDPNKTTQSNGDGGGTAVNPADPAVDVSRPPLSQEDEILDLFARGSSDALPALDQAMGGSPDDTESLIRGAFAGVGNNTEKCQEILLYLTVRHPDLANSLASAAYRANPEVQSFLQ